MIKTCPQCGKEFKVKPSHSWRVNCSMFCYNQVKKGRYIPNGGQFKKGEHRSIATEFSHDKPAWNKGMAGCVNSGSYKPGIGNGLKGESHYNWMGGKSFEPYGKEFNNKLKEQIRQRDDYRCQECFRHQDEMFVRTKSGISKKKLSIHHIDYNKNNNNPENLISLCLSCHMQTNFSRENWISYFSQVNGKRSQTK